MEWNTQKLTKILFAIYLLALIWIILFKFELPFENIGTMRNLNLSPYAAPTRWNGEVVLSEMILNLIVFIPFGIYLEMLYDKASLVIKILGIFLGSIFLEGMQYILAVGITDITDVIHNMLGGVFGITLYQIIKYSMKNTRRAQQVMNRVALVSTVFMLGIFVLYRIM